MKKLMTLALATVFTASSLIGSYGAERNIRVTVDNGQVNFTDSKPYVDENYRTLVPVSFIAKEMGATVKWYEVSKTAEIVKGDIQVQIRIGSKTVNVNGEEREMDTVADTKDGRTMVPIAFISQYLGATVNYIKETDVVQIITPNYTAPAMQEIEYSKYFSKEELAKDTTLQDKPIFETSEIQGMNVRLKNAREDKKSGDGVVLNYTDSTGLAYSLSYIILSDGRVVKTVGNNYTSSTFRGEGLIGKTIDKVCMRSNKGKRVNVIMDITDIKIIDTITPKLEAELKAQEKGANQ